MNVSKSNLPKRRARLTWLALAPAAALLSLSGCALKRCATWERVTHPDYMHEEHTTLHGFHRTTWDSWPEEYRFGRWSRTTATPTEAGEGLPSGEPVQELPQPEKKAAEPQIPESFESPEARRPRARLSNAGVAAPMRDTVPEAGRIRAAAAAPAEHKAEAVDLVAGQEPVAADPLPPDFALELDAAPAPFASRFAGLIATDRKSKWRRLNPAETQAPAPRELPEPAVADEVRVLPSSSTESEPEPTVPATARGDGAVQFRVSTTTGPTLQLSEPEAEMDEAAGDGEADEE